MNRREIVVRVVMALFIPETHIGIGVEAWEGKQQLADGDYARPSASERILINSEGRGRHPSACSLSHGFSFRCELPT